jgi:glycosyltransferase involved in cell wall biosynthesis
MSEFKKSELANKPPLISVLMPVYNVEQYLRQSIESILLQSFKDFEFIIIDDGSTDNSKNIVSEYANKDSRIKFFSRENKGIVKTRNELLQLSKAKYFAIMDGDDISSDCRLEEQFKFLTDNPEYLIVGCRDLLIDPDGDPIKLINTLVEHDEIDQANLKTNEFLTLNAYMAITKSVKDIGAYREEITYAEDRDLFLRLAELGKVKVLPSVLYKYRQHHNSVCAKKRLEINQSVAQVIKDAHSRRRLDLNAVAQDTSSLENNLQPKDYFSSWAWWALDAGNVNTARKYALKLLYTSPLSLQSWRLLYCALRGH